jgi:hypothetical protein
MLCSTSCVKGTFHVSALNRELKERKPLKKSVETQPKVFSSSSVKAEARSVFDGVSEAYDPNALDPKTGSSRGKNRKDGHGDSPSPSPLTLAQGLSPMLNGEVLHPFSQQNADWVDLWLEQDGGVDLRVFAAHLRSKLATDADKIAIGEVSSFIMNMMKKTRLFQQRVDRKSPTSRVRTVLDRASRATAAFVASTPARKQSKQQRRSSAGIGRDLSEPLPGFVVEWNVCRS